jgi:hypothetical protein
MTVLVTIRGATGLAFLTWQLGSLRTSASGRYAGDRLLT